MTRRVDLPLVLAVVAVGVATRLSSLHLSPLPYNTDGFVFASSAERVLAADGVALTGAAAPAPDQYLFVTLAAVLSDVTGIEPLFLLQVLVACLAVVPSLVAVVYVWSLTADLPRAYRRGAAAFAGIGLSLAGPYLFRTMSVNGEVYGLAVLFCLLLALHRAVATERGAWAGLAVLLAAVMPFAHNLSALLAGLVGTILLAVAIARRPTVARAACGTLGASAFWALTVGYYEVVSLPKAGAVTASLGLFVAWVVLTVAAARWLDTASSTVQRAAPLAAFGLGVAVFVANAVVSIYPGTATTTPLLIALVGPLCVVLLLAALGLPRLTVDRGTGAFAVVVGPLAAIGFGLTAGSTPLHQDLVLRASTFVYPGAFVAAAVGLAWLTARRPRAGAAAATVAVGAVLVSSVLPFAGVAAFPFEPVTEPDEFGAATFATERVPGGWATDDHLALVSNNYRDSSATAAPTTAWLRGDTGPSDCPTLARESWTTIGVPTGTGPSQLSPPTYETWRMLGDVVYAGGADGEIVLRWADGQCSGPATEVRP